MSGFYGYLKGVSNELAQRHAPRIEPRRDTLAGPLGRRGDQARTSPLPRHASGSLGARLNQDVAGVYANLRAAVAEHCYVSFADKNGEPDNCAGGPLCCDSHGEPEARGTAVADILQAVSHIHPKLKGATSACRWGGLR